ncbi:putative phage integrase [Octadecabacter antarcticus 307]|uniref:Putative phage integrase n=1 Tax=Octadecabacter antarcticus 307 TaxID=391626 RepID=M9R878_9RHOB|nr:site-specific integrase [Octadecabacter antarcticus]AGI65950.1 putative phage integrase [Octadecabacter antarcticus 307]
MAQTLHRLTDKQIAAAAAGANLNDGGGLSYRVAKGSGAGKWAFRFTSRDADFVAQQEARGSAVRQRDMGLGTYPSTTLAAARKKATAFRLMVSDGHDPIEQDRRAGEAGQKKALEDVKALSAAEMTFGRYADENFLPEMLPRFANAAHVQQWEATFATHAKTLRNKPLAAINRIDVLGVLKPIWETKNPTATRSRERIERLFSHAIQNGHFKGDNPAAWTQFDHTLSAPKKLTRGHHNAIPHGRVAELFMAISARQEGSMSALMLEWITLSACRTGEARFAVWDEIDLELMIWAIPAERMKMRRGHEVPITKRMAAILADVKVRQGAVGECGPHVFSEDGSKALSKMTALMFMRRLKGFEEFTVHGLRATFKTWTASETTFPRELIEEQLAHQLGAVERAYMRGSAVERRRPMMEAWADHCAGLEANEDAVNVVTLTSGRGA